MGRRIVTEQLQSNTGEPLDGYFDRLFKYIPAEIVAAWVAAAGIIASTDRNREVVEWIAIAVGALLTLLWILRRSEVPEASRAWTQAAIATVAFLVWVFALGRPFLAYDWYEPAYGSLVLIVYTVAVPLIVPTE